MQTTRSTTRLIASGLLILLGCLPFWSLNFLHLQVRSGWPTGFATHDAPYYFANGREVFEAGTGITYPNPYDPSGQARSIYFHWLVWLMGAGVKLIGIEPGRWNLILQTIGGLWAAERLYRLIQFRLPDARFRALLFLVAIWGGGQLVLTQLVSNLLGGQPLLDDLLKLDPVGGWWFLNFGRNLTLTTESFYHALMLGLWLALLEYRWKAALVWLSAVASTHPFTGAEAIAITINTLIGLSLAYGIGLLPREPNSAISVDDTGSLRTVRPSGVETGRSVPWWFVLGLLTISSLFYGYYLAFLPAFPEHRPILQQNSREDLLPAASILPAYLLVMLIAAANTLRQLVRFRSIDRGTCFFLISGFTALALAKHELVISARQPIHFERGYIWISFLFAGLPLMQHFLITLAKRSHAVVIGLLGGLIVSLFAIDNSTFLFHYGRRIETIGFYFTPDERSAFAWFLDQRFRGNVLCTMQDRHHGYLLAVYTDATPFVGHELNTPNFHERSVLLEIWKRSNVPFEQFGRIDAVLGETVLLDRIMPTIPGMKRVWTSPTLSIWARAT